MNGQPASGVPEAGLTRPGQPTLLESALPFRELSLLADADRRATDPIYTAHKWWARRPPALMRALLLAAALPADSDEDTFWEAFAEPAPWLRAFRVHDPFVGGGSTLVEAARLGAAVSGSDIDPLAVEIARHELAPPSAQDVRAAAATLLEHLQRRVGWLYPHQENGATPLHYFWLHDVTCPACGTTDLLYRNLVLARDLGKPGAVVREHALTVFCPQDLTIHHFDKPDREELHHCRRRLPVTTGTFSGCRYTCHNCGQRSTHRDLQTGVAPRRLLAVEETTPGTRRLRAADATDTAAISMALVELARNDSLQLPTGRLRTERNDQRPVSYGIETPAQLFSGRQLAVFGTAMAWLRDADLEPATARALTLGVSNALATNNKLCGYATDYGRLSALFSVRGYPLPALPVELNPLHPDGGRGTIRNCIERVARSAAPSVRRHVWSVRSAAPRRTELTFPAPAAPPQIVCATAESDAGGEEVDLCLFDPPYFDYIDYSELSEFYRCWTPMVAPAGAPLLPAGRTPAERFGLGLAASIRAALRRLAPGRPLVFTYHSANPEAWQAIAIALDDAKVAVTSLWPVRSDGHMGHHSHPGNCEWDMVVCCRRLAETRPASLSATVEGWVNTAQPLAVSGADRSSMALAIATAAPRFALPAFTDPREEVDSDPRRAPSVDRGAQAAHGA